MMFFKKEELDQVVDQVKSTIQSLGQDPEKFEISGRESDASVRVAIYTDDGGFMVRLFGTKDFVRLEQEIREFFGLE